MRDHRRPSGVSTTVSHGAEQTSTPARWEVDERGGESAPEAEVAAALQRAHGHAVALGSTLDEAGLVLARAGLDDHARRLATLRELERMVSTRIAVLVKRIVEGE